MTQLKSNTKPLKIAIIGSRGYPYVYSGYETLIKELSERLVQRGCKVTRLPKILYLVRWILLYYKYFWK